MSNNEKFVHEFNEAERAAIYAEFSNLTADGIYLDHAGATLYAVSQIESAADRLKRNLLSNPHTNSATDDLMDQVRYKILQSFNTTAEQYTVVFTANATAALKLVAECFDSNDGRGNFYYCKDNHTSVLGMRNVLNVAAQYMLTKDELLQNLAPRARRQEHVVADVAAAACGNSLLAFAAQCNFSGYKLPLRLIGHVQEHGLCCKGRRVAGEPNSPGLDTERYYICLDAASYAGTSYLDLSTHSPDYVCISFYKIFGYPTGVGALLVSRRGAQVLKKRYYGGGTINYTYTDMLKCSQRECLHERFEDGTLPFISIAELLAGYRTIEQLVPANAHANSMQRISRHVHRLAKHCAAQLEDLQHANGKPVVKLYNFRGYDDEAAQGGIVSFNLLNEFGLHVGFAELACIAALHNVLLRTGCCCNIGACASYLGLSRVELEQQFMAGRKCGDYNDLLNGRPTGAVRVSFGYMSRLEDVDKFVALIAKCFASVRSAQRLRTIEQLARRLPLPLQHIPARMRTKVERLCVYPVKACAAVEVHDSWPVCEYGFKYDRQWMVVDASGRSMTQSQEPGLCLLGVEVLFERAVLRLSYPRMPPICVPLELRENSAALQQSKVCSAPVAGQDCGDEVAAWLSDCFNLPGVRLLRQMRMQRMLDGKLQPLSFVNQGQFLVVNAATARWLAHQFECRLASNDPIADSAIDSLLKRFRGNIVIDTGTPLEENEFDTLEIDGVTFNVDSRCTRCEIICVDQDNADKEPEVLRSLALALSGKIEFGIYVSLAKPLPENATIKHGALINVERKATA